ncbi:hypothetical protein BT63DRAFT_118093 [Microthyrium microscopicum]|uniref:CFEM domain-containing protein n=1 Tax=Microthyrium microscopicum TaxID=703497 RepID=A0A6A6TX52_9PEZI|nr:hypothetical protein BT63DRAFT_118093 [Microthyrium microscopicum]
MIGSSDSIIVIGLLAGGAISDSLPTFLSKITPSCAQSCFANGINSFKSSCSDLSNQSCLCSKYNANGNTLGEVGYSCLYSSGCSSADAQQSASGIYNVCQGTANSATPTHTTLVVTGTPKAASSSVQPSSSGSAVTETPSAATTTASATGQEVSKVLIAGIVIASTALAISIIAALSCLVWIRRRRRSVKVGDLESILEQKLAHKSSFESTGNSAAPSGVTYPPKVYPKFYSIAPPTESVFGDKERPLPPTPTPTHNGPNSSWSSNTGLRPTKPTLHIVTPQLSRDPPVELRVRNSQVKFEDQDKGKTHISAGKSSRQSHQSQQSQLGSSSIRTRTPSGRASPERKASPKTSYEAMQQQIQHAQLASINGHQQVTRGASISSENGNRADSGSAATPRTPHKPRKSRRSDQQDNSSASVAQPWTLSQIEHSVEQPRRTSRRQRMNSTSRRSARHSSRSSATDIETTDCETDSDIEPMLLLAAQRLRGASTVQQSTGSTSPIFNLTYPSIPQPSNSRSEVTVPRQGSTASSVSSSALHQANPSRGESQGSHDAKAFSTPSTGNSKSSSNSRAPRTPRTPKVKLYNKERAWNGEKGETLPLKVRTSSNSLQSVHPAERSLNTTPETGWTKTPGVPMRPVTSLPMLRTRSDLPDSDVYDFF